MIEVSAFSTVVASEDMVAAQVDGDFVMLDIERGKYYGLATVGSRIWQLVATPRRVSEIVAAICSEFDVAEAECERDIKEFIRDCVEKSMISIVGE